MILPAFPANAQTSREADSLTIERLRAENARLKIQLRDLQSRVDAAKTGASSVLSSLDAPLGFSYSDDDDTFYSIVDGWDDLTERDDLYVSSSEKNDIASVDTLLRIPHDDILAKYIDIYTIQRKNNMIKILGRFDQRKDNILSVFRSRGIPDEIAALCIIESAVNPKAVSKAGAAGLWQLMPATARDHNLKVTPYYDERFDPDKSTVVAADFLKSLYGMFKDWKVALMAYNCGPGNMQKAIAANGGRKDYETLRERVPRETREYVSALVAAIYVENNRYLIYE